MIEKTLGRKKCELQPWMAWQRYKGRYYLYNLKNESLFVLDDISSEITDYLVAKKCSIIEAADLISRRYGVSKETVCSDIEGFVKELEDNELIRMK